MAQTTEQRRQAARHVAFKMFVEAGRTANLNLEDLRLAVGAIDDFMDSLPPTLNQVQTIKQNAIAALPEPFKSNSTAQQKAVALMAWAMKEAGII